MNRANTRQMTALRWLGLKVQRKATYLRDFSAGCHAEQSKLKSIQLGQEEPPE